MCIVCLDKCGELPTPSNGNITLATDGQITSAEFCCDAGYSISDAATVTAVCGEDGVWDVTDSVCGMITNAFVYQNIF